MCDSQCHPLPPHPTPGPGPASLRLKKAPGNVTFFLRRCDGRRWPRRFSCWPIQRLGTVTVPLNPEAGFLPPIQAGQNSSPFPASRTLPSASPGAPEPARLSPGPCLLLHVYSVCPSRTGHCPWCGHSPICQMGWGCTQTPWSSSSTPRIPMLPTRIPRSYWRHSLAERQVRVEASSEERAPGTSDHPSMQLSVVCSFIQSSNIH